MFFFYSKSEITEENLTGCLTALNFVIPFKLNSTLKKIRHIKIFVTNHVITSETEL